MSFPRYAKYRDNGVEWLGEVPSHWKVMRFQRCVAVAEGQVDPEHVLFSRMSLIAPNHIESGTGRLLSLESATEQGAESGKYLCNAGDVVYSKIRPSLRKVCIAPEECLCSADMYPLRPHGDLTNHFLFWLILSEQFSALAVLESERVAMPKINRESLKAVMLAVPPSSEQSSIVGFLDRETAKIDALVGEQQRLIELLKEKRQAVISRAVTKGLNPHAPMKPSGIEWLGDVPEQWEVLQLGKICRKVADGPHFSPTYVDEGVLFLSGRNIRVDRWSLEDVKFISVEDCEEFDKSVVPEVGDVLYTKGGTTGIARAVDITERFQVWVHVAVLKLRREIALPDYVALALNSTGSYEQSQLFTKGATNQDLGLTRMVKIYITLPPLDVQTAIVEYLRDETKIIDNLMSEAEHAIDLLQERRTALISAAVTGKIDVRGLAESEAA